METYLKGFVRRKLVEPKWMDLSFFAEEDFQFQQLLDSQGLKTFVSLNCNYFIELIKVFYCNLKMVDGDLVTEVKTTPIRITPSDWLAVTGLNHEGAKFSISAMSNWEGYDRATAIRGMLKDPSVSVIPSKVMVGKLTVEDRMLHYAFAKILIPRGSNYSQLAEEDVFVLWALKNGILINWPYYISKHMMKVKKRHMMDLPYAFLITKFLFHFQIDTRNEGEIVTKGLNKFGWTAINHMKLKKVNGVWITTGDPAQAAREDEPHDMNAEELSLALVPAIATPDDRLFVIIIKWENPNENASTIEG
ncbi:hypothetical protein SESBI_41216 [Sesbania bispinosa]|nr:hypothetical protein SESBI_41216 [Sesbania bispinosa]